MCTQLTNRRFATRQAFLRGDCFHLPGRWSPRYAYTTLCVLTISTAVRKNRYVILPIDFEEAWKVSGVGGATARRLVFPQCERGARFQNQPYKMSARTSVTDFLHRAPSRSQKTGSNSVSTSAIVARPQLTFRPVIVYRLMHSSTIHNGSNIHQRPPFFTALAEYGHPHPGVRARLERRAMPSLVPALFCYPFAASAHSRGGYFTGVGHVQCKRVRFPTSTSSPASLLTPPVSLNILTQYPFLPLLQPLLPMSQFHIARGSTLCERNVTYIASDFHAPKSTLAPLLRERTSPLTHRIGLISVPYLVLSRETSVDYHAAIYDHFWSMERALAATNVL